MCAETLITHGQRVVAFISQFIPAQQWAAQKEIPWFNTFEDFLKSSQAVISFDFLFSIVNFAVLPSSIIQLPKKLAINYHDALLPKYAGLHATSWALLNGETEHGISFHIMTAQVDKGDILIQDRILIEEHETAFSLNLKCHQQALVSFEKLLDKLVADNVTRQQQDLSKRTYFRRYHPLPQGGFIDWNATGESIDRLCRALDFGNQVNTLGSAKFTINDELYVLKKHEIQPSSGQNPGTISKISDHFVQIATQTKDIQLLEIKNSSNKTISIIDFISKYQLHEGSQLNCLSDSDLQKISQEIAAIAKYEDFWIKQFSQALPLAIPFLSYQDKKRESKNLKTISHKIIKDDALTQLIQLYQKEAEPCQIILAALLIYFYRLNNCEQFSIGFAHSQPNPSCTQQNSKLFSKWLPLNTNLNSEDTFTTTLSTVTSLYEKIIQQKTFQNDIFFRHPEISKPYLPVTIAIIDSEKYYPSKESPIHIAIDTTNNLIVIYFTEDFIYTIDQLIKHFPIFLNSLLIKPTREIKYHSLLTTIDREKILVTWNQTKQSYSENILLHQLFEKQVVASSTKVAITFENQTLTFAELNQKANQLAHYINKINSKSGSYIIIYQTRNLETIISMLAVLKSGNIYVPIAAEAPLAQVQEVMIDCQAAIILTQEQLAKKVHIYADAASTKIVMVDKDWSSIAGEDSNNLPQTTNEQTAYVMYTSGSTGKPKGVQITHRSLLNILWAMQNEISFIEKDILLAITPIAFDISGLEIYLPLISGAQLVLANQTTRFNPQQINQCINEHQVTVMQATPATWQMLVNIGWQNELGMKMLCGGEGLSTQLTAQLYATRAPLWNLYGPTETTIWSTAYKVEEVNINKLLVSIGKPVANTQVYVLDKNLQPVPVGIIGELFIGGDGVGKNYLNKDELTKEKFIFNPFSNEAKSVMYRTGDLVRWLPDGNLEYISRIDNQIKIRGLRVELGEIESCLLDYPGVKQTIVISDTSEQDKTKLIAYLVLQKETSFSKGQLVTYLKEKLYEHMVPSYFVVLESFPLNANGKIDKKALPLPTIRDLHYAQKLVSPTNKEERLLAEIWSNVLAIPLQSIGINDNFFELGGHSLLAIQVITRISSLFFVTLDIRALFEYPTIKQIAPLIHAAKKTDSTLPLLLPVKESQPQLLSFNQMRLWFLNEFYANSAIYNLAVAWHLTGEIDQLALNKAIIDLIKRQGVFRSVFLSANGKATQILLPASTINFELEIKDLSDAPKEKIKAHLKQLAAEAFKTNHGKLFRFQLLKLADNECVLFICLHHLIADGWSFSILYRELSSLYQSYYNGVPSSLQPLSVQYIDFSVWQHKAYNESSYKKQKEYWKKQLKDLSPLELPTDFNRPTVQTYNGSTIHFKIPEEIISKLRILSQEKNTTLFTVIFSAFGILLAKYANQTDIAIGIPIANRNIQAIENIIGFFVNTLVIRFDLSLKQRFTELLEVTQNTILDAYTNGDMPFERIIDALQPERDQSRNPLFQVMFAFNNAISDTLNFSNVIARQLDIERSYALFELSCFLEEKGELVDGYMEYNTDLFTQETVQRFIDSYLIILTALTIDPQQRIDKIPILSSFEKKLLLIDWNKTHTEYPKNTSLIQLIEEQVSQNSEKIALIYQEQQLTYSELNKQANQLAHFIKKLVTKPQSYIAVYFERSIEKIVSFLAIMKSGNIYVPIEKNAPFSLMEQIITDAKVSAILTKQDLAKTTRKVADQVGACVIMLDDQAELISQEEITNLEPYPSTHLAYVLYTSGSTGKPKGVQITHQSLVNFLLGMRDTIHFTEKDTLLAITPVTFDISGLEIYLPLICGASFIFADYVTRFNPQQIVQAIDTYKITVMQATPATWQMLISIGWQNISQIKMLCGGEGLSSRLAAQLHATGAPLWNLYGPTETTIWSTYYKVNSVDISKSLIPIGQPLANTQVYVLNENLQPTPIGVAGELYIGGDGVAQGYLNNPETTQQKFITNIFSQTPNSKIYKTGDIVVWSSTGELHFLGRSDSQIKIRGHRIEAEAIENILVKHADISECVVIDKSPTKEHELVAYVVLKKELTSLTKIRDYLSRHLPVYMIPTKFFAVDQFPLTFNGKIDRKIIPDLPNIRSLSSSTTNTPIQNNYEMIVIDIIKRSLNLAMVDPQSNFFDLGMHSLLLIEFSYALSKAFKRPVNVTEIFAYPTVRLLTNYLTIEEKEEKDDGEVDSFKQRADAKRSRKILNRRIGHVK
jgi:amino acid adenylation domain-containing protein